MTREDIEELVRVEAARAGVRAPTIRWTRGKSGSTGPGGRTIYLPTRSLADAERIRFTAMHELGHVVLGHQARRAAVPRNLGFLASLVLPGVLAFIAAGVSVGNPAGAVLMFFGGVLIGVTAAHFAAQLLLHPAEYEADAWAAARGGPMTPGIAQQLTDPSPTFRLLARIISTHPTPAQRLERVRGDSPAGSATPTH